MIRDDKGNIELRQFELLFKVIIKSKIVLNKFDDRLNYDVLFKITF